MFTRTVPDQCVLDYLNIFAHLVHIFTTVLPAQCFLDYSNIFARLDIVFAPALPDQTVLTTPSYLFHVPNCLHQLNECPTEPFF